MTASTVDRLADWVASKGGRVTRRDVLRANPCGIRTKDRLDEVLVEYQRLYPGAVHDEAAPGGGPKAQVISAPGTSLESPPRLQLVDDELEGQKGRLEVVPRSTGEDRNVVGSADNDVDGRPTGFTIVVRGHPATQGHKVARSHNGRAWVQSRRGTPSALAGSSPCRGL